MQIMTVFVANFVFVFFKAFQQRNVAFMHYKWVMPISLLMAFTELYVISAVALRVINADHYLDMWPLILAVALGGGLGALSSMYLHNRYLK